MYKYSFTKAARIGGLALGAVLTLFAASPALAAGQTSTVTNAATGVSSTSMTLSGTYTVQSVGGADTWFQYGTTSSMSATTPIVHDSNSSDSFSATLTGLTAGTKYYYRAIASNSTSGPGYGTVLSTTTATVKNAQALTIGSENVTATSATLMGAFAANGGANPATEFVYGTSSTNPSTETQFVPEDTSGGNFTTDISGLTPDTTYYFKAVLQTDNGTVYGTLIALTTLPGNGNNGSSSCVINSFTPSPTTVTSGSSTTLTWSTSNCSTVMLNGGEFSNVTEYNSSVTTQPLTANTTYTLTASDSSGATTSLVTTVAVTSNNNNNGNGGNTTGTCSISSFYASPAQVAYGNNTTLYWNTSGCTTLSVTPDIGSVNTGSSYVTTGSIYQSTNYVLTGTDAYGTQTTYPTTVTVSSTNNGGSTYCAVNSFYGTPSSIANGQSATLSWTTTGCTSVTITGGSLTGYSYLAPSGSLSTGTLYGTTNFVLTANGSNSTTSQATIYVTNSQYPYIPTCGNGSTDPSCSNTIVNQNSMNVISLPASNIGTGTTRLNGIIINANTPVSAYFEYGPTVSLGSATTLQPIPAAGNLSYYDTISVAPGTTYYYRAVVEADNAELRGSIMSFTTQPLSAQNVPIYINTGFGVASTTATDSQTLPAQNGITLTITDTSDTIQVGNTVDYTVVYTNGSNKKLTNALLSIVLPQGMTLVQTTQGRMTSPSTVEISLGTLAAGQTGSIFLQATVGSTVSTQSTLVTNGTLSYTYPNGTTDSTVGYVLNHASAASFIGGFSLGSGFFPTTLFGWFITILIILALILVVRRIVKGQDAGPGGGGHH